MTWRQRIIAAHVSVTSAVSHFARMKSDRYFVWQEEGARDLIANGVHTERAMRGTTDLFTKLDGDPWAAQLEAAFDGDGGIAWQRNGTWYEPETGFIHTEWVWSALDGEAEEPEAG